MEKAGKRAGKVQNSVRVGITMRDLTRCLLRIKKTWKTHKKAEQWLLMANSEGRGLVVRTQRWKRDPSQDAFCFSFLFLNHVSVASIQNINLKNLTN